MPTSRWGRKKHFPKIEKRELICSAIEKCEQICFSGPLGSNIVENRSNRLVTDPYWSPFGAYWSPMTSAWPGAGPCCVHVSLLALSLSILCMPHPASAWSPRPSTSQRCIMCSQSHENKEVFESPVRAGGGDTVNA